MEDGKFKYSFLDTRSLSDEEFEKYVKGVDNDYRIDELPEIKNFTSNFYCVA